ncbi:MAG: MBL fold metallo-hydrolase [Mycobacterium sp.]|nr:MBL fold metallo-hydrolase [Mycobacterium sp.]
MPGPPAVKLPGRPSLRLAYLSGLGTASLAVGGWALSVVREVSRALGADSGAIRAVTEGSANHRAGAFRNLEPDGGLKLDLEENRLVLFEFLAGNSESRPRAAIPMASPMLCAAPAPLAVTWLGHATALLEIDGYRLLTDPVWSERCSPSSAFGPQRLHPPPVDLDALPALDAVVISHDHYDHLDMRTVQVLARTQRAPFVVPLGVGAHLREWGIPADRVVELDWNTSTQVGEITLACTPARHFSGRFLSRNNTLWSSWAILGPHHRAYFGGDSGYTRSFADIGSQYGPFDLTLLPIGAYNKSWPDIHMNPEEAVQAHRDLDGGLLVPIHWGTFRLAPHPWAEPPERLIVAAAEAGVNVAIPKPGDRAVHPRTDAGSVDHWWRL